MKKHYFLFAIALLLAAANVPAQENRFVGYNIILDVPERQQTGTCATRYAAAVNPVTVTDRDQSTPMKLRPCAGSAIGLRKTGPDTYSITAEQDASWCFMGEDKNYQIDFQGDLYTERVSYLWPSEFPKRNSGFFNVREFGAEGDGVTDDTVAIKSALAYVASRNGGVLIFPEGEYIVGDVPGFKGLALPSGITIRGSGGLHSGASTNNRKQKSASRITLKGNDRALFRIGECTEKVAIEDIELFAESSRKTRGVEAVGAYLSAQGITVKGVSFNSFYRGMQFYGLPQTNLQWQVDYVKVKQSRFIYNTDAGIFCNAVNSDWAIEGTLFVNPEKTALNNANSMHFERVGMVLIKDTFGGGFQSARGGTFINILDSGNLTIIGSQTESMTNSLVYNAVENPGAGDYSYPITIVNSIFADPIVFKARRTFVSTGSLYGADTFTADPRLRVYSTGDRFCYDGYTLACRGATKKNFDKATILFMTGQPDERSIPGHPTYFGTNVEFGMPVKLPSLRLTALPQNAGNGSMVFCEDCTRNTTPCEGSGAGAPAMRVNGEWSCL